VVNSTHSINYPNYTTVYLSVQSNRYWQGVKTIK